MFSGADFGSYFEFHLAILSQWSNVLRAGSSLRQIWYDFSHIFFRVLIAHHNGRVRHLCPKMLNKYFFTGILNFAAFVDLPSTYQISGISSVSKAFCACHEIWILNHNFVRSGKLRRPLNLHKNCS